MEAVAGTIGPQRPDVGFVLRQIDRMPLLLRLGAGLLGLLFQLFCILRSGRLFQRLSVEKRASLLAVWRNSSWLFCRDFVLLYEGLLLFSAYAHLDEGPRGE